MTSSVYRVLLLIAFEKKMSVGSRWFTSSPNHFHVVFPTAIG